MPINISQTQRLKGLDLFASQVVEGFITGIHKSPFHGFSVEFAEHRLYNTGESTRHIDWKLFAKTDKLFVKRYEEETNLRCNIIIDTSSSMYFGRNDEQTKVNFSIHGAAALCNLLKKQRDAFGITLIDEKINKATEQKSNEAHYMHALSLLENTLKEGNQAKHSNIAKLLDQIAETTHRRSLIVIFSDMFDNIEDFDHMLSAMRHLKHNKHEVILFHVLDTDLEISLDYENRPYIFIDKETNEEVRLNPYQIKETYTQELNTYTKNLKNKCLTYKIDYVPCDIKLGYFSILQHYFIKRQKMLR